MSESNKPLTEFYIEDIVRMDDLKHNDEPKKKKRSPYLKFIIYFALVIVFTGFALFFSLKDHFHEVVGSIKGADYRYLLLIIGLMLISYLLEGLVILLFVRLYTRKYHYRHGLSAALVCSFYDSVTPGATGGQLMQIMTIKRQGLNVSNATSIVVMYVIIKQFAMVLIDLLGVIFQWKLLISIGYFHIAFAGHAFDIPALPLTLIGFAYNVVFTLGLILLSYWKGFHNFISNVVIGFLGKIKIVKKPDELRKSVNLATENFRVELKRLFSNIPVFIFTFLVCAILITIKYSLPFFAGLALNGYGINEVSLLPTTGQADFASFWNSVFLSSYHQMTTCLIPLPGSAGISEIFFNIIFENYYINESVTTAAQIIWRSATYYLVLVATGIFSATYSASPKKDEVTKISRNTMMNLQLDTLEERKGMGIVRSGKMYDLSSFDEEIHKRKKHSKNDDEVDI